MTPNNPATTAMNPKNGLSLLLLLLMPIGLLAADAPVRVAIFDGDGVGPSALPLIAAIEKAKEHRFQISRITAAEIHGGKLANVDVLVHPGGSGGGQGKALGEIGRKAVRDFVHQGGGYLGVCGGAYLATNDYEWSLKLIDAKVVDKRHWARGTGTVQLQLSPAGSSFFNHPEPELSIHYGQGPLLARPEWDDPDVPDYESLAIYKTEIALKGAPQGVMARTSAAVRAQYGKGRVFCFSPHPELTDGLHHLIPLTVQWAAGKE
jgi:glutamine amidotransferase-like uncharacterized protein